LSVTFRYLKSDELTEVARLITHSFPHRSRTADWWAEQLRDTLYGSGPEVLWVGEEGGHVIAACQLHRLHQWVAGAAIPVMGLATVTIAPTHRRRGIAADLVASGLDAARRRGELASALYPFRASFYRKLGYGMAGEVAQFHAPPSAFPASEERSRVEMADTTAAHAELRELYRRWGVTQTGQMARSERVWEHLLATPDRAAAIYRAESGAAEGYALVTYRTDLPPAERFLEVEEIAWLDPAARRGLLAWLGSLGDQWRQVVIRALPAQRLEEALEEPRLPPGGEPGWGLWYPSATLLRGPMFRLLDLQGAWEVRGIATESALTLALDVQDPQLNANAGEWIVRLEGGRAFAGRVGERAGADLTLRLDIETLSRLFIGAISPSAAARAGLAVVFNGADRLAELDRALAIPQPWTFDRF
jgi:predicted acetyltransferase